VKVLFKAFNEFTHSWEGGLFPSQRFGQAFLNHFSLECPHEKTNYCLFHEQNNFAARRFIQSNFIDYTDAV